MTVGVGPTEKNPSHVFSLSDGTDTIGFITCNRQGIKSVVDGWTQSPMPRTALKTSSGSAKYEDFELPFTSIIQDDFSGGMNAKNFDDDKTKYRNGRYADTMLGNIICGPKETKVTSLETSAVVGDSQFDAIGADPNATDENYLFLSSYTPTADIDVEAIAGLSTGVGHKLRVYIYSSSGGAPDTQLEYKEIETWGIGEIKVYLDSTRTLLNGTEYFIGFVDRDDVNGLTWHYNYEDTGTDLYWKKDTTSWAVYVADNACPIKLYLDTTLRDYKFFHYKQCLYAIANFDNNSAPELYRNGYTGCGKSNSADKSLLNTDQDLSGVDLTDCIVKIIEGPGHKEQQPWRIIESNTTTGSDDVIKVTQPWKETQSTETTWVVLGSDDWTEITGHGLTKRVVSIEVTDNYVMFAQGDDAYIRRFRAYNNSGTWTLGYEADGTASADLLLFQQNTEGDKKIWKCRKSVSEVQAADLVAFGAGATSWGTSIIIGNIDSYAVNMIAYGDPTIPYIFKEDIFGSISNDIWAEIPIGEMKSIRSSSNGAAAMAHGVYLYFSMGEKIERYYDRRLDDVGLDKDEGRPEELRGNVKKLLSYPGRYYALIHTEGRCPSINCFNGLGWFELWRNTNTLADGSGDTGNAAPFAYNVQNLSNDRMNDIVVQVVPGTSIDRLWFDCGGELYWLPITINPTHDTNYIYKDLAQIETGWIYGGLRDVIKYWHSIKIHSENLSGTDQIVKIEYKIDEDTDWTTAGYANSSPIEEVDLSSSYNVTGYRIKFRLTLHTSDSSETPKIIALVIKGVTRVDVKRGWSVTVISDAEYDLNGDEDDQGDIKSYLDTWANSETQAAPLTLRHNISYYDNKYVFIDPASIALQQVELAPDKNSADRQYKEIISFTMYEV